MQTSSELEFLGGQVAALKEQTLEERGFAGGADFWLKTGESVNIGDREHVLGVVRTWNTAVDVIMNGRTGIPTSPLSPTCSNRQTPSRTSMRGCTLTATSSGNC